MLLAVLVATSFAAGAWMTLSDQPWAFFSLPTRAWELGVGGILAFVVMRRPTYLATAWTPVIGWTGIAGIAVSVLTFTEETQFPGWAAALPVVSTAAVILAGTVRSAYGPSAALSIRPMLFIGAISYSLYLVHWPLQIIPQAAAGFEYPLPLWATLMLGLVSVPLAWLMYRYVENPARDVRYLSLARPRRSLLVAGLAPVLAVALVTGVYAYSNSAPLHADKPAEATRITDPPVATDFVPSNLAPSLRAASEDQPRIYDDGCHLGFGAAQPKDCIYGDPTAPRVVLFGDSHASQWFPAVMGFAEQSGMAVEVHAKSSCPSVDAEIERNAVPYTACSAWRDAVIDRISDSDPELVILANYGDAVFAEPSADFSTDWGNALGRTLERIEAPVVVMADTPDLGTTPAVCLSANLLNASECGQDSAVALGGLTRQVEEKVTAEHGETYIDLTKYICEQNFCAPIIGNTLAYRDAHHLTATFSAELTDVLADELRLAFPDGTLSPR